VKKYPEMVFRSSYPFGSWKSEFIRRKKLFAAELLFAAEAAVYL